MCAECPMTSMLFLDKLRALLGYLSDHPEITYIHLPKVAPLKVRHGEQLNG